MCLWGAAAGFMAGARTDRRGSTPGYTARLYSHRRTGIFASTGGGLRCDRNILAYAEYFGLWNYARKRFIGRLLMDMLHMGLFLLVKRTLHKNSEGNYSIWDFSRIAAVFIINVLVF